MVGHRQPRNDPIAVQAPVADEVLFRLAIGPAVAVFLLDIAALLGLFAANSAMILFGLLMERQQSTGRADW
ncbi:MAG: hypothetical protein ACYCPF_22170, partial [Streptosporangiaceae bacterium]